MTAVAGRHVLLGVSGGIACYKTCTVARRLTEAGVQVDVVMTAAEKRELSGMGATLNTAVGKRAYALTDRGTWLAFANKDDFKVLVEGDDKLFNQYGVILVNPARHPNVKVKEGQAFIDWLVSSEGQAAIASYKIDGQQLFFPNARPQS